MNWQDTGFLLSKNKYSENNSIAEFYTKNHGKVTGVIYGSTSKKIKNYLLIGNKFHLNFNSKNDSKVGYFKLEIDQVVTPLFMDDKNKLLSISYSMSLINQIILLQEVDNKLFEIEKLLGDLPAKVEELTKNEDDIKISLLNKENELKETSVLISTNETLVETTSEKINSLKDKLIDGSISTNKEYDAMMETIDFEKNLLSEKENELINLMSKKEELAKEIEEDKSSLDGIIAELNAKKDTLNDKMQEVSEEQNALKSERESVTQDIDPNTMSKYAEIYKARKGLVVAEILDGSCEGCGAMVPPQSINEALSQNIVFCGNCSRFLYKLEN